MLFPMFRDAIVGGSSLAGVVKAFGPSKNLSNRKDVIPNLKVLKYDNGMTSFRYMKTFLLNLSVGQFGCKAI